MTKKEGKELATVKVYLNTGIIAGFLMQKGFQNRDLTRLYIGNMFSMNFKD